MTLDNNENAELVARIKAVLDRCDHPELELVEVMGILKGYDIAKRDFRRDRVLQAVMANVGSGPLCMGMMTYEQFTDVILAAVDRKERWE